MRAWHRRDGRLAGLRRHAGTPSAHTAAALKLHVRYDLCHETLTGPLLTDGPTHENRTPVQTAPLPPAPCSLPTWASSTHRLRPDDGTGRLTAPPPSMIRRAAAARLWTCSHRPHRADTRDVLVTLGVTRRLPARLLAVGVPLEVATQRRRRVRAPARAHGHHVGVV